MGFLPCSSYVMMLPKPLVLFLLLLDCFSFSFSYLLHVLGLKPYPHATLLPPWDDYALYLQATSPTTTAADLPLPLLLPLPHPPSPATTASPSAAVTETLRVVHYFEIFSKKQQQQLKQLTAAAAEEEEEEEENAVCVVCLEEFAGEHRVRELGNCDHAFHAACIDRWAETGRATCPLCRSPLQPTSPQRRSPETPGGVWFPR
ncbi:probable E3 ubiquitin-protein ligase XERICO [Ananas comosus]|uniref:Probable E3 ubiquitin-protein ligase XERICO n=1 Tax=Ananas comosus TaxID=4615 RepID=A0A199UI35_ANACO|nr:probable E3 ubiquitin-protein ligase XERICO [Ananas comosus]OAY64399.1 RING-H2 zinc finger protein RHA1a [Ananas comosus]